MKTKDCREFKNLGQFYLYRADIIRQQSKRFFFFRWFRRRVFVRHNDKEVSRCFSLTKVPVLRLSRSFASIAETNKRNERRKKKNVCVEFMTDEKEVEAKQQTNSDILFFATERSAHFGCSQLNFMWSRRSANKK